MLDDFKPARPQPRPAPRPVVRAALTSRPPKREESFLTPEQVAAKNDDPPAAPKQTTAPPSPQPKQPWYKKLPLGWPPTKKQWIIYAIVGVFLLGAIAAAYIISIQPGPAPIPAKPAPKYVPRPTTVPSALTGLPVKPEVNKRPVIGVMIENSPDARPQSGLADAGVVFEAIAEGGITRFLALFQDTQPAYVGPVRSARPYYVQWAQTFDAAYAHVGGSPEALQSIKAWGVRDLDQFYNSGAYQRTTNRYAPHNVYTSIEKLTSLAKSKGFNSSNFTSFERKEESPSKTPTAKSIDISFSGALYNTHYAYDAASNSYKRSEGGSAHIDEQTKDQIAPKVVIALVMGYSLEPDGYHSRYDTLGSGHLYVFQDGTVTQGTWTKSSRTNQFSFTDMEGHPVKLNPGQTWISAIRSTNEVSYKP